MSREKYVDQAKEALVQAKVALNEGDLDAAKGFRETAETAQDMVVEYDAITGIMEASSPPAERPPLPGTNGTKSSFQQPPVASPGEPEGTEPIDFAGAAYISRFGESSKAIGQILRELHGENYEQKFWEQKAYFNAYLRRGEKALDGDGYDSLRQIIATPSLIEDSLYRGMDSVKSMKATLVEAIDTLGGFGVPVDFQARIIEKLAGFTVVRPRAQVDSTSRDMVEIPTSTTDSDQFSSAVRVTWVDETPTAGTAATNPTFGLESVPIHTVMAETPLSRNMVEDVAFDVEGWLVRKFAEASAMDEDNKFLIGTGVKTPQGILPASTNGLSLTSSNSGSNSAVTWNGLISLMYDIPSQYRANAVWIAERGTYEAIMKLQTANGYDYLWNPWQYAGGDTGQPMRLMGFPVLEQEVMPSIAQNAYPVLFGDLGGYQIFDRVGMTVERYLDSTTARTNTIMYVMRRRLGGQVTESWRFAAQKISA